jgi:hypothetical protein
MPLFTLFPCLWGRSHHHDPYGKTEMKTWTRVVLLNLALNATGLRAWFSPWLPLYSKDSGFSAVRWAK